MDRAPSLGIIPLVAAAAAMCAVAQGPLRLSRPEKTVVVNWNFAHQGVPKWERGVLLDHGVEDGKIVVIGAVWQVKLQATVGPPGAQKVRIADVTQAPRGGFVAAIGVVGETGESRAYLAWLDAAGRMQKLEPLENAAAVGVEFAPDGTLWALVRKHDADDNEIASYDMLEHYSADGNLVGSALPRQSFPTDATYPAWFPCLHVTKDRIGFLSNGTNEWVEVSPLDGKLLGRWGLQEEWGARGMRIDSAAMTPGGDVYLNTSERDPNGVRKTRFNLFRLDRAKNDLIPMDVAPIALEGVQVAILGGDGNRLVATQGFATLDWVMAE
jgi:hypothetical protein